MGPPQTPKLTQRELDEKIRSVHTELVREQATAMRKLIDKTKAMLTPNVLAKVRGCAMRMSMLPQAVCVSLSCSVCHAFVVRTCRLPTCCGVAGPRRWR